MTKHLAATIALFLALSPTKSQAVMSCSIGSIASVAFGSYDIFSGSPLDSTGTVTYRCDNVGGADTIIVQLGKGSSTSYSPRTLIQGSYELHYNFYLDAARSSIWGDGTSGTSEYGPILPSDGVDTDLTIYARVPAAQNAHVGAYSDTVVVTLVF
jgi:spore coat protein U-like protein